MLPNPIFYLPHSYPTSQKTAGSGKTGTRSPVDGRLAQFGPANSGSDLKTTVYPHRCPVLAQTHFLSVCRVLIISRVKLTAHNFIMGPVLEKITLNENLRAKTDLIIPNSVLKQIAL